MSIFRHTKGQGACPGFGNHSKSSQKDRRIRQREHGRIDPGTHNHKPTPTRTGAEGERVVVVVGGGGSQKSLIA